MKLKDLPIRALVMDPFTTYYGKPIIWKVADKNHEGYPENSVTLITDRIICLKSFDAKEPNNSNNGRIRAGNNRYIHSNIHQFLNSDEEHWFVKQHSADEPPSKDKVENGYNDYNTENGFLTNFSTHFKNSLLNTNLTVVKNSVDGGGSETFSSKIFLASNTEVGVKNENGIAEGSKLALFSGDDSRIAKPTSQAIGKSDYRNDSLNTNRGWFWWLRTPSESPYNVKRIYSSGSLDSHFAVTGSMGIRPLCNVTDELELYQIPDIEGVYIIKKDNMKLCDLYPGSLVIDKNTKYNDEKIVWRVLGHNHDGDGTTTLEARDILTLKAFDAKEPNNPDFDRKRYGNNNYKLSNILEWLNSDEDNWYQSKHSYDQAPELSYVNDGYNQYKTEKGFLRNFSRELKTTLRTVSKTTVKNIITDGGGSETVSSKLFLLSTTEVGLSNEDGIAEGKIYDYYKENNSNQRRQRRLATDKAKGNYNSASSPWHWWLRTPNSRLSYYVRCVYADGSLHNIDACWGGCGISPAFVVSSEIKVNYSTTENAFVIEWNQPPTTPSFLNFRNPIRSNKEFSITWGQSTDSDAAEGEQITYVLERKLDENNWIERYRGTNLIYNDTIAQGSKKVMYRVKAVDNKGGESEWKTSEGVNVVDNLIPVITSASQSQADLGVKDSPFSVNYMITDEDEGQTYTVTEYIDDVQKRSYVANLNEEQTFTVTEAEWKEIINGAHRLKVKVGDSMNGQAEKVFNFSKNEDRIEVSLATPLPADDIISVALINVDVEIPEGAVMAVEACNNGFDTEPVWQNVTKQVKERKKIFFANEIKTAANWGLNVRVKVQRNGAVGDCIIRGIGGNFE